MLNDYWFSSRLLSRRDHTRLFNSTGTHAGWYLILLLTINMLGAGIAAAQEQPQRMQSLQTINFNIPPQSLGSALNAFAETSGWQVSFPAEMAAEATSPGVSGTHTPEAALQTLLAGTGLTYRFTDAQTITLMPAPRISTPPQPSVQEQGPPGPPETVSPEVRQKPVKLPEVVVKEIRERDDTKTYVAEEATTATRTETPVRDIPQSVQVITRKVIQEQRNFRLQEALENVSGINTVTPTTSIFDGLILRGFQANQTNFFRNGLFDPLGNIFGADTYNIQRIEVLKGPASVLYGQGVPGGIINITTRRPLPDSYYAGNVTLGNFNFYRSEVDATGPLNESKTLLYRLNVAGQRAESFIDIARRDLMAFAPSVTWLMGPRTTLTVEADYMKRWYNNIGAIGVPAQGSVLPNVNGEIPRNLFVGLGDLDQNNRASYRIGYDLTHQFNNTWSIRNAYRYAILEIDQFTTTPLALLADQRTLTRRANNNGDSLGRQHVHNMITNLIGHFRIWEMDHTLLTGVELRQNRLNPGGLATRTAPSLDIFAPNYSLQPGAVISTSFSESDTKQAAFYLQDQIDLLPNLKLLGGFRFDYVHQFGRFGTSAATSPDQNSDDTAVSPRVGLVYQPIEPVSLYASWMRGFLPNDPTFFNPDGKLFEPERSTQYEVGMKTFFLQNRMSATLAWFHLTRENLLTPDPVNPLFQVQTGEQRSQGVELDVTASLTAGWNVIASYAYTDAEVTADNNLALIHKRLANVPYNKATLWSTYYFQEGALKGFGLGGGVFGYTSRNASIFGVQREVPGYVRLDTALYYNRDLAPDNWLRAKTLNIALNFRNLLDQRYIQSTQNSTTLFFFGEPRTVLATVGLQF